MKSKIAVFAVIMLFIAVNSYCNEQKLAVVNMDYILKTSKKVSNEKIKLKSTFDKLQADLSGK